MGVGGEAAWLMGGGGEVAQLMGGGGEVAQLMGAGGEVARLVSSGGEVAQLMGGDLQELFVLLHLLLQSYNVSGEVLPCYCYRCFLLWL